MANILFRGNVAPSQPVAVSGGSAAKGTPLTNDEGDWNYKALNDDIQTRAPINNPSFTGVVNFGNAIGSTSTNYRRFISAFDANITTSGYRIGEYLPTGNSQNATIVLDVTARTSELYARSKTTIAIRSNTLPAVVASIQSVVERNGSLGLDIQAWTDTTTGKVIIFAVPNTACQNMTSNVDVYEKNSYNGFTLINTLTLKNVTGLTQVTPTSMSSYGYSIDFSQVTGTIPGDRGVTAGSTNTSFVTYNGTTSTTGQFDGGTTAPSDTTRLNYSGYLYATRFYGDGSNLTALSAANISSGTLSGDRGVTAGSTNTSFVTYNGNTSTTGQFDGGTTAPSDTTRLNYGGYLYATRFYGDGSNLTALSAANISSGTLGIARGGTGGTTGASAQTNIDRNRALYISPGENGQTLTAGAIYSGHTVSGAFTVYLPASPSINDRIEIWNLHRTWSSTNYIRVQRTTASHNFTGYTTDAYIDLDTNKANCVEFIYAWTDTWQVSIS